MLAEQLVADWPGRWPRPDAYSTKNAASQVKHFAAFFAGRELRSITRDEGRRYALAHPGAARYARTMLNDALDAGLVSENVLAGVRLPAGRKKVIVVPTIEEVEQLTAAARSLYHSGTPRSRFSVPAGMEALIVVSAYTGLREGEARALAIEDLELGDWDEDARAATMPNPTRGRVDWQINREEALKRPKTARSRDSFAFLGPAPQAIGGRCRVDHNHRNKKTAVRDGRVFPFTRSVRQAAWDRVREHAEVSVPWHSLRHFCATWLLDKGATMDDVALQLRCTVDEVRKTYGHPDREQALGRLEAIAGG